MLEVLDMVRVVESRQLLSRGVVRSLSIDYVDVHEAV